jgi:predicted aspartyl protease
MQLTLVDTPPFVTVTLFYDGRQIEIPMVLVDTGSASTVLSADMVSQVGLVPEPDDILHTIRGVGGAEVVFIRQVDRFQIGSEQGLDEFEIEVGGMDYGFEINGILGMDFLMGTGAIINLRDLRLEFV